jgi:hypothetical protein
MAITVTQELDDVVSTTIRHVMPDVIDNFFDSRALFVRLASRNNITLDGGHEIQQPFLFDSPPGGAYGLGDELDITRKNILSAMLFPWALYYSAVTVEGLEQIQNAGASKIVDLVEVRMQAARMKLEDSIGSDLYGSKVVGPELVGLRAACDNGDTVGSYGGITRATTGAGSVIKGNVDATAVTINLKHLTDQMGAATKGAARPDLIVTTQDIWDSIHDLIGGGYGDSHATGAGVGFSAERNLKRFTGGQDLADAGFQALRWQGADIVVDNQCPANHMYFLNTEFIKLFVHSQRSFVSDGPWTPANRDQKVWRIFAACQLVNCAPRLCSVSTNVS